MIELNLVADNLNDISEICDDVPPLLVSEELLDLRQQLNGNGTCIYTGEWQYDLKHGQGTMLYPNDDVYTGGFKKGKKHGHGKLVSASGDVLFEGKYVNGKKQHSIATKTRKELNEVAKNKEVTCRRPKLNSIESVFPWYKTCDKRRSIASLYAKN